MNAFKRSFWRLVKPTALITIITARITSFRPDYHYSNSGLGHEYIRIASYMLLICQLGLDHTGGLYIVSGVWISYREATKFRAILSYFKGKDHIILLNGRLGVAGTFFNFPRVLFRQELATHT